MIVIQLIRFDCSETKTNKLKSSLKMSYNNDNSKTTEKIIIIDWIGLFEEIGGFVVVNKMINNFETSYLSLNVIMNLLFVSNSEHVAIDYSVFIQPITIKENYNITNPLFLTSLFTILSKQSKEYIIEVLNNMKILFENRENGNIISYEPMCIYSLLKFYYDNINNYTDSDLPPPPPSPITEGLKSPKPESSQTNEICEIVKSLILTLINISIDSNPLNSLIFYDLYSADYLLSPDDLSLFYELLNSYTDTLTKKVNEIIEEGGDTSKSIDIVVNILLFIEPLYLNYYPTVNGNILLIFLIFFYILVIFLTFIFHRYYIHHHLN